MSAWPWHREQRNSRQSSIAPLRRAQLDDGRLPSNTYFGAERDITSSRTALRGASMRSTSLPSHASGRESLCVPSPATGLRAASLQSERTRHRPAYGSLRLAARPPRRNPGNQEEPDAADRKSAPMLAATRAADTLTDFRSR